MRYPNTHLAATALAFALGTSLIIPARAADSVPSFITASLSNYGRPQADLFRDKVMNPAAVMAFAGIKPGQAVAHIMPGNGY